MTEIENICKLDECTDDYRIRQGYCNKHYLKWQKYGDPRHSKTLAGLSFTEKLLAKRDIIDGCWIWTGTRDVGGYGKISIKNKLLFVHRLSFEEFIQPLSSGSLVGHTCDIRACFNPEHLFETTHKGNSDDMVKKGRQWNKRADVPTVEEFYTIMSRLLTTDICRKKLHVFSVENTIVYKTPDERLHRRCRACGIIATKNRQSKDWVLEKVKRFLGSEKISVRDKILVNSIVEIVDAYGVGCAYCFDGLFESFDHVVPKAQGGQTIASNLVPACLPCNLNKNKFEVSYFGSD